VLGAAGFSPGVSKRELRGTENRHESFLHNAPEKYIHQDWFQRELLEVNLGCFNHFRFRSTSAVSAVVVGEQPVG
jgi:hypothetical protein